MSCPKWLGVVWVWLPGWVKERIIRATGYVLVVWPPPMPDRPSCYQWWKR